MINLELLFWASKHGGKREWYDMAVSHALKTMVNHARADGSTYQIVNYNPTSGAIVLEATKQGYNTESTWSRGQAWAVYGFTMAYRETGDVRFLETARKTADYFISHLPADQVPFWDFELPDTTGQPKDSSAAAIASSGLIELSQREADAQRSAAYLSAARNILISLSSPAYLAQGTTNHAVLLHGTQNKPDGKYDRGLIYGDYYFIEALLRYSATSPATPSATAASATPTGTPASAPTATPYSAPTATPAAPPGSPIKSLTFEGGSLTGANGADSVSGAVSLETSTPIKGSFAARIPNSSSGYLRESFTSADTGWPAFDGFNLFARRCSDVCRNHPHSQAPCSRPGRAPFFHGHLDWVICSYVERLRLERVCRDFVGSIAWPVSIEEAAISASL